MAGTRKKRFLKISLIALGVLVLLVILAPFVLEWTFRGTVREELELAFGHDTRIGELELGWFDGVHIRDVVVRHGDPSYAHPILFSAQHIHIDQPLTDIPSGVSEVLAEGVVLRLESQRFAETKLATLIRGIVPTRDAVPGAVEPSAPMNLRLRRSTIEIRSMVPRRVRAIDPYRQDPEIVPADHGTMTILLTGVDLDLRTGDDARLSVKGGVEINGAKGTFHALLERGRWEIHARGVDLAPFDRFLHEGLRGVLDADYKDNRVTTTVRGLKLDTPRRFGMPRLDEESLTVRARLVGGGGLEDIELFNADKSIHITGQLRRGDATTFRVKGQLPRATLSARTTRGTLHLDSSGRVVGNVVTVTGTVTLESAPDPPMTATADFDYDFEQRRVEIRTARGESGANRISFRGHLELGDPASGPLGGVTGEIRTTIDAELSDVMRIFGPLLRLDEGVLIAGHARSKWCVLTVDDTQLVIDTKGSVKDLRIEMDGISVHHPDARVDLHASASRDLNDVSVTRGLLLDSNLTGHVHGARERVPRSAHLEGELHLTPMVAALLHIEEQLGGTVGVNLDLANGALHGTITGTDLRFGERQAGHVTVTIHKDTEFLRDHWHGSATVEIDGNVAQVAVKSLRPWSDLDAEVTIRNAELSSLLQHVDLPDGVEVLGTISPVFSIGRHGARWSGTVTLPRATRITVRAREHGIHLEEAAVEFRGDWTFSDRNASLRNADLTINGVVIRPRVELRDGDWEGRVTATGTADALRSFLPAAEEAGLKGRLFELNAARKAGRYEGFVSIRDLGIIVDGKRLEADSFRIDLNEERLRIRIDEEHRQATRRLIIDGTLSLEDHAVVIGKLAGGGNCRLLEPWLPRGFTIRGGVLRWPFDGKGALRVAVEIAAPRITIGGNEIETAWLSMDIARAAGAALDKTTVSIKAGADRGTVDDNRFEAFGITLSHRASKTSRPWPLLSGTLRASRVYTHDLEVKTLTMPFTLYTEGLRIGPETMVQIRPEIVRIEGHELDIVDASFNLVWRPSRDRSKHVFKLLESKVRRLTTPGLEVVDFSIPRWETDPKHLERVILEPLATVNGGKLWSDGATWIDFSGATPEWRVALRIEGARINGELGEALRIVMPLLIDQPGAKIKASGKLDLSLIGHGRGITFGEFQETADIAAHLNLSNVRIENSRILGLIRGSVGTARLIQLHARIADGKLRFDGTQKLWPSPEITMEGVATLRGRLNYTLRVASLPDARISIQGPMNNPTITQNLRGIGR